MKKYCVELGVKDFLIYERDYENMDDMIKFKTSETLPINRLNVRLKSILDV